MFPDQRQVLSLHLSGAVGDDYVLAHLAIPADKELRIYGLKASVSGAAANSVEVLDKDDTTSLASVLLTGGAGSVASATLSATPVTVASSSSEDYITIQTDGDPGATAEVTIELHYGYVGAA